MAHTAKRHHEHQDAWDKFWKDKHGEVVVYQHPNVFLLAWAAITIASIFVTNGKVASILWYVSLAVLAVWALLEIWKGVNYFRKALGAVVLLLIIAAVFRLG